MCQATGGTVSMQEGVLAWERVCYADVLRCHCGVYMMVWTCLDAPHHTTFRSTDKQMCNSSNSHSSIRNSNAPRIEAHRTSDLRSTCVLLKPPLPTSS